MQVHWPHSCSVFCELKQHRVNMRAFTFACPITNMIVQKWIDDDKGCATENDFQGFVCPACSQLHWMNSKTGKLLGEDKK